MIKSTPSKLFKLKEWLTLPDAAKHLSGVCGEEVTEADLLRFALDGHLKISVYFVNGTHATPGYRLHIAEDGSRFVYDADENRNKAVELLSAALSRGTTDLPNVNLTNEQIQSLGKKVVHEIRGVWDLAMVESEILDLEHRWQMQTGGPAVTLPNIEGTFVLNDKGDAYQLQESYDFNKYQIGSLAELEAIREYISEHQLSNEKAQEFLAQHKEDRKKYLEKRASSPYENDFHPAGGLPSDSVLVVRTQALREFEQFLSEYDVEKDLTACKSALTETERNTMLKLILGMAMDTYGYAPNALRNNATGENNGSIKASLERIGINIDADTIRKYLNEAKSLLPPQS